MRVGMKVGMRAGLGEPDSFRMYMQVAVISGVRGPESIMQVAVISGVRRRAGGRAGGLGRTQLIHPPHSI